MRLIRIEESKKEKMSEHAEKALKHLGKLMTCIEDMGEESYGERDDDDWEDDDEYEGMRGGGRYGGGRGGYGGMRRSRRTGRYIR